MRNEESAGGVIVGKKKNQYFMLLLKDHKDKWTFPKGLIEDGEDKIECAAREVEEEVSLSNLTFIKELFSVKYRYKWKNELVFKTVHYYLFEGNVMDKLYPQKEEGISDVKWFTFKKAFEIIGYRKTNLKVLEEACNFYAVEKSI